MTEIATQSLAARRARARTLRAVNWERCAGAAGVSGVAGAGSATGAAGAVSATGAAGAVSATGAAGPAGSTGTDPVELVALLPSTEAATVLLLCELAAELTG